MTQGLHDQQHGLYCSCFLPNKLDRCHVVLQECASPEIYSQRVEGMQDLLEDLGESIGDEGRLYSRTQLACLCAEILGRPIVPSEEDAESFAPLKVSIEWIF